jgi:hypothetical protein
VVRSLGHIRRRGHDDRYRLLAAVEPDYPACGNIPDYGSGPATSRIVVQNITFEGGYDGTHQTACTTNEPQCWDGGVDGGGAIYAEGGQFKAEEGTPAAAAAARSTTTAPTTTRLSRGRFLNNNSAREGGGPSSMSWMPAGAR